MLEPLRGRIAELERKLGERPRPPAGLPPSPPNDMVLFLQTRMELLEHKLALAEQEAMRASLVLREREDAQRRAAREVEDLFRSIREQQRAASFDKALRGQYGVSQDRIRELEERLALAELRAVPAEEILRWLEREGGQEELKARLRRQVEEYQKRVPAPEKPVPPSLEVQGLPAQPSPQPEAPPKEEDASTTAAMLGRICDLERRLEESETEKRRERVERVEWENSVLRSMKQLRSQWQKAGGPELLVEAALEGMVDSLKDRDAAQKEMAGVVSALRDEPPDSQERPALRARLEQARRRFDEIQAKIDGQLAVVQAWTERE